MVGRALYVANSDAIVRFPYQGGETEITTPGTKVVDLPAGPINHHWTKNIIASRDGSLLYATVGSNSNVGENGLDKDRTGDCACCRPSHRDAWVGLEMTPDAADDSSAIGLLA